MEALQTQVELIDAEAEVISQPANDLLAELTELELALVGGGAGDPQF